MYVAWFQGLEAVRLAFKKNRDAVIQYFPILRRYPNLEDPAQILFKTKVLVLPPKYRIANRSVNDGRYIEHDSCIVLRVSTSVLPFIFQWFAAEWCWLTSFNGWNQPIQKLLIFWWLLHQLVIFIQLFREFMASPSIGLLNLFFCNLETHDRVLII